MLPFRGKSSIGQNGAVSYQLTDFGGGKGSLQGVTVNLLMGDRGVTDSLHMNHSLITV
jgi:hypothetical protein